ncbi:MAG: Txe/YoeB family addiction module toxin [Bacilli bacterium]|nr:Txe/YoeB family addiction module toxin [Bacilli bacterium]MBR5750408.1 Txe/YoeB family addiction module toxin [Bacilli bacterium]
MWSVKLSKRAIKDKELLKGAGLAEKAKQLLKVLINNPFQNPPSYEKLVGDFAGFYSRRINRKHRLIYRVDESNLIVYVDSMWSHYER